MRPHTGRPDLIIQREKLIGVGRSADACMTLLSCSSTNVVLLLLTQIIIMLASTISSLA